MKKRIIQSILLIISVGIMLAAVGCKSTASSDGGTSNGNSKEGDSGMGFFSGLFSKEYEVGKNPKLEKMYMVVYESGTFSSDYGQYIYDGYEAHYSEGRSYVVVDTFDKSDEKQVKVQVDISDEACLEIFGIVEGCKILKKAASDPNVMDGFMDSSSSRFEARWEKEPDGEWYIDSDWDTKKSFIDAVKKAAGGEENEKE